MTKPRICYITYGSMFRQTGYQTQCKQEVCGLAMRRYKVLALAFENHTEFKTFSENKIKLEREYKNAGAKLLAIPIFAENRKNFRPLRYALDLSTIIFAAKAFKADILHVHNIEACLIACHAARLLKIPVINDMHGLPIEERLAAGVFKSGGKAMHRLSNIQKKVLQKVDHTFVVSEMFKNYLTQKYLVSPPKISVTRSFVDCSKFYFDSSKREITRKGLDIKSSTPLLLFIGSVDYYQAFDRVIDFVKVFMDKFPDTKLLCLTNNVDQIAGIIDSSTLKEAVYIKSVTHDQVNDYLSAADYGLVLRENDLINQVASPVKFAEYISAGLPVIISEGVGDCSHFVKENNLGVLMKSLDISGYQDATQKCNRPNDINLKDLRGEIKSFCESEFSLHNCLNHFEEIYKNLIPECD